jgi:hypothetical protein
LLYPLPAICAKIKRMSDLKLNAIKHALTAHHKNVVQDFHKKHALALSRAKRHYLSMFGAAIVTASALGVVPPIHHQIVNNHQQQEMHKTHEFVNYIKKILQEKKELNRGEEQVIAEALSKDFGITVTPELDGNKLNEIVGYMGAEQHLKRWAGDNLSQHGIPKAGMAPRQGAFKDFDNAEQEKYYVAVQLHELPNWDSNWSTLKPWYRYRKVLVFNPANAKGVIAVIGDAGPAKFTGKTFGGSPELMEFLEMQDGAQKGKAIILFVDDHEDKIALGPIHSQIEPVLAQK